MFLKRLIPILIIFIATCFLFGKTLIPKEGQIIYGGDLQDQFYYWKSFYKENISKGVIPFWNPYSFSGMPFLAHPSIAAFYPLNGIFLLFPIPIAFSLFLFLHILIAGVGMYWYGIHRWDKITSLTAAFMFAFSGMFASRIFSGHIDIISTLAWIPFVLGSLQSVINQPNRKNTLFSIFFLTVQILAGYQLVVLLTLIFSFFYFLFHIILNSQSKNKKVLIRSTVFYFLIILLSFGITMVQILPTFQLVHESIRKNGLPYELTTWGSYFLDTFRLYIDPFVYGNPLPENYSYTGPGPNYYELSYFVGRIPLIVISLYLLYQLIQIIRRKKYDGLFFFYLISLLFYTGMALGNHFFFHKLFYVLLPPFRLFRFPAQYLFLSVFILSMLYGQSISKLKRPFIKIILLCFISIELFHFSKPFYRLTSIPTKDFDTTLTKSVSDSSQLNRTIPDYPVISYVRKALDFESYSLHKIQSTSGYNPIILDLYFRFIASSNGTSIEAMKSFNVEIPPPDPNRFGVNYLNGKYIILDPSWNTFYRGIPVWYSPVLKTSLYTVYENKNVLPRFYFIHTVQAVSSTNDVENVLKSNPDLSKQAILVSNTQSRIFDYGNHCDPSAKESVEVISYNANSIQLKTNAVCNALLASSEVMYPGWKAKVDGTSVGIQTINLAFRGVPILSGSHTIILYYDPTIYFVGLAITITSLLCGSFIFLKAQS